ncbi:hypothetical protein [Rhodococcus qingshengii]|uniref:Uncharacterized protein n=1 Tax=Rhodococcus qingshengii TaxID=334542 RepID=A0A2A5IVM0_RHOSG|nr:hypothetical protein [Rhodococcus qingshengii]PCK21414.1 hypothetical protein CHR55_33910 [Rhodococcus qingshengii]
MQELLAELLNLQPLPRNLLLHSFNILTLLTGLISLVEKPSSTGGKEPTEKDQSITKTKKRIK